MKYEGRLVLISLSILSMFVYVIAGSGRSPAILFFSVLHIGSSWFIGGLYDKYKFLSYHDTLTGVFNRRYVYKIFKKKIAHARRKNDNIGFLMLDINDFKEFNDRYGHDYGDFILQEVCRLIQSSIGKDDILVRWGGDEFLLLLNNLEQETIHHSLKKLYEDLTLELMKSSKTHQTIPTLSIGFSLYPEDATNLSDLVAIADKNMYHIKNDRKV